MVKVSQLMIGDWLKYGDMYVQVGGIDVFGNISLAEDDWQDHQDEFDNIPLSAGILELNGFEITYGQGWQRFHLYMKGKCVFDCGRSLGTNTFLCQVGEEGVVKFAFVHELQHLLTIRGLNDIAVRLKLK